MDRCKMKWIKQPLYFPGLLFSFLPSPTIKNTRPQRYQVIVVLLLENLAFAKLSNRDMQYLQKCSPLRHPGI